MITLSPLPYADTALEPNISAKTLSFHYGKHHQAYVDKTNELIGGTELEDKPVEDIIAAAREKSDKALYNQSGQVWNHGFYWASLTPEKNEPSAELSDAINASFGSMNDLKAALKKEAIGHFASGWAWVVAKDGSISVQSSHDAETMAVSDVVPLLVVDVWEHAYYLDKQNARKAYVDAVVDDMLNWEFASSNFAANTRWTYPG